MTVTGSKSDPVPAIFKSRGGAIRAVALVASLAGLVLPAATSSAMSMSQSTSMLQLAGWFVIAPIAIGGTLVMPAIAARYSRLADIVAAVITVMVLGYAAYSVFDAWHQATQLSDQASGMMRSMAGNNPQMQGYANTYGQSLAVGVVPGIGLAAYAVSSALLTFIALRGPK